jgi:hypothetical protein
MGTTDRHVGQGAEGLVRITLDLDCDLVDVTLDPRARRLDTDELAAAFSEAYREARTALMSGPAPALGGDLRSAQALEEVRERRAQANELATRLIAKIDTHR